MTVKKEMDMDMAFADEILANIPFDYVNPHKDEVYGLYRIDTPRGCVEFIRINRGMPYEPHIHDVTSAQFIFVMGRGVVLLDGEEFPYEKGSVFNVPAGVRHGFEVEEDTIFLSMQSHPILNKETGEKDIRYS